MKTALALSAVLISGCALDVRDGDRAKIRIQFPGIQKTLNDGMFGLFYTPLTVNGLDCYAVNVTGPGIPSKDGHQSSGPNNAQGVTGNHCTYPGELSFTTSINGPSETEIEIPTGPARRFQIIGLKSNVGCGGDIAGAVGDGGSNSFENTYPFVGEIDSKTIDVFQDTSLTLINHYSPKKSFGNCGGGSLPIVHAMSNVSTAAAFNLDYTGASPPAGTTNLGSAQVDILDEKTAGNVIVETITTSQFAHLTVVFDATPFDLGLYSKFEVIVKGNGGYQGSTCSGTGSTTGGTFKVKVWKGSASTPAWSSASVNSSSYTYETLSLLTNQSAEPIADFPKTDHSGAWSFVPGGSLIHVGIESNTVAAGSICSTLSISSVSVIPRL